jgi:hypothetical protein
MALLREVKDGEQAAKGGQVGAAEDWREEERVMEISMIGIRKEKECGRVSIRMCSGEEQKRRHRVQVSEVED